MGQRIGVGSTFKKESFFRGASRRYSFCGFFLTFMLHLLIIFAAVTSRYHKSSRAETVIKFLPLPVVSDFSSIPVAVKPPEILSNIQFSMRAPLSLPELIFEGDVNDAVFSARDSSGQRVYEFPSKKAGRYKDVFNPVLRKKLEELPERKLAKPKIQSLGVGVTLEDIGDGMCIYGDASTNTGRKVKCGPNQGEKMLLNVERALSDPLQLR